MQKEIFIKGARENNLKNIDVTIPRDKLVVLTGLSGSGKSSLAFDTIYAEGQRRYVESLSSYARMFLGQMDKPDVDYIDGLSPAISIDQKTTSKNPRSTVGTVTEIYDYLRLLWARVGVPHCPKCGREIRQQTVDQIIDQIMALPEGTRIQVMAPVIRGRKTEKEKFKGAEETYTVECMMHDHKALQAGTSHFFGDGFAKAFDITFTGKDNQLHHPFQTSWGVSTRMIGGIIMTHGDDNGLVLPPRVAPVQAVVIPVAQHKPGVLDAAAALRDRLKAAGIRTKMDDSDNSPGWKFAEYEMKGVPLRVEIGPKDMEKEQCVIARRDTGEKVFVPLAELEETVKKLLDDVHNTMYAMALKNREDNSFDIKTPEEAKAIAEGKGGFMRSKWCGSLECEMAMKERAGVSSRCMPLEQSGTEGVCPVCGKKCTTDIYWGVAY